MALKPISKIEISRKGSDWKIVVEDISGGKEVLPQNYNSWRLAANHLTFMTLTNRGLKINVSDKEMAV